MTANRQMLEARAGLYRQIRDYFDKTGVMEVVTPVLSFAGNPDPAIDSFSTDYAYSYDSRSMWLHTSPEFFMKRLLCQGSGSIYQICQVFRQGEKGRFHNPEFAMLEWYRIGYDYQQLMQDVQQLITSLTDTQPKIKMMTYQQLFDELAINPLQAEVGELAEVAKKQGVNLHNADLSRDQWLDVLMSHVLEPAMDKQVLTFVYDYPESQASLARIRRDTVAVAERFELYWGGVELANGFTELTDANEQRKRFERDLVSREANGQGTVAIDENFLTALTQGMPECSGVALGLDRLLMVLQGADSLEKVLSFHLEQV